MTRSFYIMLFAALMLGACPESGVGTPDSEYLTDGSETPDDETGAPPPDSPPELLWESVIYDESGGIAQQTVSKVIAASIYSVI
jgi:hypothetical protein